MKIFPIYLAQNKKFWMEEWSQIVTNNDEASSGLFFSHKKKLLSYNQNKVILDLTVNHSAMVQTKSLSNENLFFLQP